MLCAQQPVVLWGLHCARNGPASCAELVPYFACARRQRQEAIAKRADAKLATVIISERYDKKAAKYATPGVPFPFDSKDTYERSIRQPLGRDFNTDASFRCALPPACRSVLTEYCTCTLSVEPGK